MGEVGEEVEERIGVGEGVVAVGEVGEWEKPVRHHISTGLQHTQVGVLKYKKKHIVNTHCKQNFRYRHGHGASSLAICWEKAWS